ncbi:hypothetical protein [Streptomyces sp.]|uniref:hypothetical protein n=1 Tax=Streptomyces sp. TaxID=1931 RepID=UPI002F3EC07C
MLGLLRRPEVAPVPVMLLHCYPYHREAGYLAQVFGSRVGWFGPPGSYREIPEKYRALSVTDSRSQGLAGSWV